MMFKAKNIVIIFTLNFVVMVMVFATAELWFLSHKATHVQDTMRTAGDMALEQIVVTDDMIIDSSGSPFRVSMPASGGNGFVPIDMYEGLLGVRALGNRSRAEVYNRIYRQSSEFQLFALRTGNIRSPIRYYNASETGLTWYTVPMMAHMGLDTFRQHSTGAVDTVLSTVKTPQGNSLEHSLADKLYTDFDFYRAERGVGNNVSYVTPLNLGITYLDREMLGMLFINNMDMLMRTKYDSNLNTESGGSGVAKGSTFSGVVSSNLNPYNPINDGEFTFLRGNEVTGSSPSVQVYQGTRLPDIEYKVIDMFDASNESILMKLFGGNRTYSGVTYPTKAEYLRRTANQRNPITGLPYAERNIVVAKVTFYADVVIPYSTVTTRKFRAERDSAANNYLNLDRTGGGLTGPSGQPYFTYTRYFAVTP